MGSFFSFLDHLNMIEDDSSRYEVSVSEEGFSYLDLVSDKNARKLSFEEKQSRETGAALDGSTRARGQSNLKSVETVDHDAFCFDTNLETIIRDMEQRRQRMAVFPWAAGLGAFFALIWLGWLFSLNHPLLGFFLSGIVVIPALTLGLVNAWFWDRSRKDVHFAYNITGKGESAFRQMNNALNQLEGCGQTLLLAGRRLFEDTRYTGGTDTLPDLKLIEFTKDKPPLLDLDFDVWHLRAFNRDFFFMPDHILVYDGAEIGGLSYGNLNLATNKEVTQVRGEATCTSDAKVVGTTYRFVNNDGSPDRRFNNNIEIPLIEYGVLDFSGQGLNLTLFVSDQTRAFQTPSELTAIQDLARKPVRKVAEQRRAEAEARREVQKEAVFTVVLDALNCVMYADGHASKQELARIHQLMQKMRAPWDMKQIDSRIQDFQTRLKTEGFESILENVCDRTSTIKEPRQRAAVARCLDHVMKADGEIHKQEIKVRDRILAALSLATENN